MGKRIVILGAMKPEISAYNSRLVNGMWHGNQVYVALAGIGKVAAAATTAQLIERYNPDMMIFSGAAGALDESLDIGDIGVVVGAIDADVDVRSWKPDYERGRLPFTDSRLYLSDRALVEDALSFRGERLLPSYVATADTFLDAERKKSLANSNELIEIIRGQKMKPNMCDMETSAFLQVAWRRVPAIAIRVVSDTFEGEAARDFDAFMKDAVEHYIPLVGHIVNSA